MSRLAAALLAATLLLLARPALAAVETVTLDLRPEVGAVPTHLCVVSEAKGPRTRQLLWDLLEAKPGKAGGGGQAWGVKPEAWGASVPPDRQICGKDPITDCRPKVELPSALGRDSDLFVACAPDSLITEASSTEDPRLLFVMLEHLGASPPSIDSVRLAGGVATIGVLGKLDRVVVTARSLGGNYEPHGRSFPQAEGGTVSKLVKLDISPRCEDFEVLLPGTPVDSIDRDRLRVRVHGSELDVQRCVAAPGATDALRVRVPRAPAKHGRLEVDLASEGDGSPAARFGRSWTGAWPPAPFELKLHQLTFRWERPKCIYPADACPTATLENGTTCAATSTEAACEYRCPGAVEDADRLALELPLEVTFEKAQQRQTWTDTLAQKGQTLRSYLPARDITLSANLNAWRTNDPGNRIDKVEVSLADGSVRTHGVTRTPLLEIPVPGASCEAVRFRVIGDRRYDEAVARVEDGKLEFGKPERRAKITSFNVALALGAGPAWSTRAAADDVTPVYFSGLGHFAASLRPRRPGWNRVTVEPRLVVTLGQWGFVEDFGDIEDERFRNFAWARFLAEAGVGYDVAHRLALVLGGGIGASWPLNRPDELSGKRFTLIGSPALDARIKVSKHLAAVIQVRGIFGERAFESFTPSSDGTDGSDGTADPPDPMEETRTFTAYSLITSIGVLISF